LEIREGVYFHVETPCVFGRFVRFQTDVSVDFILFFPFLGFAEQQSLLELSSLAGLNIRGDNFLIVSLRCHKHVVNGARASVSPLVLCSIKSKSVGKVMY
jgi:hypothetical protein